MLMLRTVWQTKHETAIRCELRCDTYRMPVCIFRTRFFIYRTYTYFTCSFLFAQPNTHCRSNRSAATTAKYFLLHCVSAERVCCCTMPTSTVVVHVHVKCAPLVSFRSQCDFICFLLFCVAISVVSKHSIYGTFESRKRTKNRERKSKTRWQKQKHENCKRTQDMRWTSLGAVWCK